MEMELHSTLAESRDALRKQDRLDRVRNKIFFHSLNSQPGDAGMPQWMALCPGFDSQTRRHMWVEFVVGSRPCSKGFSLGSLVFLPPQKPTLQIPIRSGNECHRFVSFAVKCFC